MILHSIKKVYKIEFSKSREFGTGPRPNRFKTVFVRQVSALAVLSST